MRTTQYLICDECGVPEYTSSCVLLPNERARIAEAIRAGEGTVWLEERRAELRSLEGPARRVLVVLIPTETAGLTRRQLQVAEFAALGATVPEIAGYCGISPHTVKTHLKQVYRTTGVASRVELSRAMGTFGG